MPLNIPVNLPAVELLKNENISRSRLLRKATLPACAPARFPIAAPVRLYHPIPAATAVL